MELAPRKASWCARVEARADAIELKGEAKAGAHTEYTRLAPPKYTEWYEVIRPSQLQGRAQVLQPRAYILNRVDIVLVRHTLRLVGVRCIHAICVSLTKKN